MRNYEITDEILKIALQFIENSTFEEPLSLLPKENLKLEIGGISMSEHLQYPEMMADIELCHEQLLEICQDKHNKAVMSVPLRQTDFDIQLSAALDELKAYRKIGTVEQFKQLINAWNTRAAKTERLQIERDAAIALHKDRANELSKTQPELERYRKLKEGGLLVESKHLHAIIDYTKKLNNLNHKDFDSPTFFMLERDNLKNEIVASCSYLVLEVLSKEIALRENTNVQEEWLMTMEIKHEISLSKEEWLAAIERTQFHANLIAEVLKRVNYKGQGEKDKEEFLTDMQLACAAMNYVAEFAADKCKFISVKG